MSVPASLKTLVKADKHANLDSLPLRYGVLFREDTWINIHRNSPLRQNKVPGRLDCEGFFDDPVTGEKHYGFFVISPNGSNSYELITVMNKSNKTEEGLSNAIQYLRKDQAISPEWLKSKYKLYKSGQLKSHSDLLQLLAKDISTERLEKITSGFEENRKQFEKKQLKLENELKKQKEVNEIQRYENKTLETENQTLQQNNKLLQEQLHAAEERATREILEESTAPQCAERVTSEWMSKTGSSYKNCGLIAPILDVWREENNIVLTTLNENGESIIITDFGRFGFRSEVFQYLQKCKDKKRRGVYLVTWRTGVSDPEIKLASDTMMLAEYRSLWKE